MWQEQKNAGMGKNTSREAQNTEYKKRIVGVGFYLFSINKILRKKKKDKALQKSMPRAPAE